MTKQTFLSELEARLYGLPAEDRTERLGFYAEMIDDRVEEGLTEEEAVAEIGDLDEVVSQILADYPLTKLVKQRIKPKKRPAGWMLALIIIGSPIWLALLIAAFAAVVSLYVVLWAVIIALWAVFAAIAVCALGLIAGGTGVILKGETLTGVAVIGAGVVCAGLSIFIFFGCRAASKGAVLLTKKIALGIKKRFVKKEGAK